MNGTLFAGALLTAALCFTPLTAHAQASDAAKAEVAKRFDRGVALFDEGDNAGALAEFKHVYSTMPNAVVLYNIGLVYAAMGRPVDAVDALRSVVDDKSLSSAQHERAVRTLADQEARIGRLTVTTIPPGARISIDNVDVATTPLTAPLRVAAGSHVVGAVAAGYALARKEVVVAGNADATLELQLVRADAERDANLMVRSRLPAGEVLVDGKLAGKTPLAASLSIPAGRHTIELRRAGYVTAKQTIDLSEGATGEVLLEPTIDSKALNTEGVFFALDVGRKDAELYVDQERLGPYKAPIRLPTGPHRVRVEAAGFMPLERDVTLEGGKNNVLSAKLEPTPETRAAHDENVAFHRTWGIIGIGAGVLLAGGGAAYLGVNASAKDDARKALDQANQELDNEAPPHCDISGGNSAQECNDYVDEKLQEYDSAKGRDMIGFVGIGVGAAALVTGVVFLLTGESAGEYGTRGQAPRLALTSGPTGFGAGLSGSF